MRIDMGEVGDPIAVIARTFLALGTLHRLVAEDGADPDGGRAQPLNIVEPPGEAFEVAAMEKALGRGS